MTHNRFPLVSGVLAIAGLMTAIVADPSTADEPSQPIGPTTRPVISLPIMIEAHERHPLRILAETSSGRNTRLDDSV